MVKTIFSRKSYQRSQILRRVKKLFWNLVTPEKYQNSEEHEVHHENGSYQANITREKKDYQLIDVIGKGSFGIVNNFVYSGVNEDGEALAIKVKKTLKDPTLMAVSNMFFEEEFHSLDNLKHPNILKVLGADRTDYEIKSIAMELINGINLNVLIKEYKSISERMIRIYTKQILDGLRYIHSRNVIHRDIKSSNIMIVDDYKVKIVDFGLSKSVNGHVHLPQTDENIAGTVAYMAPEMVTSSKYDARIDIWSLGVVVFEMGFGQSHIEDGKNKRITLVQYQDSIFLDNLSGLANHFITSCLVKNYINRPSSQSLRWHPFLSKQKSKR